MGRSVIAALRARQDSSAAVAVTARATRSAAIARSAKWELTELADAKIRMIRSVRPAKRVPKDSSVPAAVQEGKIPSARNALLVKKANNFLRDAMVLKTQYVLISHHANMDSNKKYLVIKER